MNEAETRAEHIAPALKAAGPGFSDMCEVNLTKSNDSTKLRE